MASGPQYNWRLPLMTNGYSTDTGGEGPVARLSDEYLSNYNYSPPLSDSGEGPVKGSYTLKPEVAMPQDFMSRFGGAMPTGPMTLADLVKYTGGANNGVTEGEFNQLHPQVQQSILNDPGTFLRGQMGYGPQAATRNGFGAMTPAQSPYAQFGVKQGGNGDLLSLGAEGGSIDPRKMYWDPSVGLVQAPNNYKPINDTNWIDYSPYVIGGMAGFAGAAAGMTGAQAGAIAGGTTGAVAGFNSTGEGNFGDVLKGGVKGAASGYAGGWLGQNGGQLVKDFLPNGTSPIVSNAITGAAIH